MNQAATLLVFADAQGTQIELKDTIYHGNLVTTGAGYCPGTLANRGKVFTSRDGTSITFVSDTDIYDDAYHPGEFQVTGNLLFPDGTMYRIRDSRVDYIRDKDGNLLRFEYEPDPERRLLKIVDSLHREVSIEYTSTTRTIKYGRYGASGSNCGTAGFNCITVRYEMLSTGGSVPRIRDYSDPAARVKPLNVLFPLSTSSEDNDHLVVADVTWPNGKKHEFFYNNYSEVARIKLPTGGAFEYDWGKGVTKQNGADTPAGGLIDSTDAPGLIYRRVKKRRVYNESGVPQGETLYENNDNGETSGVADLIVTVRQRNASAQDIAVASHSFHDSPQEGYSVIAANQWNLPAWNEGKEFKVETTDPANPYNLANGWLQTEETQWWIGSPNAGQPDASNPLSSPYIRRITKRLPNSGSGELQTKTEFEYDSYNNETVRREYAFKNGTPDTVMRLTETQYLGGSYATSQQIHIRRLPTNIKVYGYPGSVQTLQSEKTYVYDETGTYATESCSSIPGHDLGYYSFFSSVPVVRDHYRADNPSERGTSYLARGLLTTAKRRVNGGGGWIETHAQYDVGGNIRKNWDGKNHPTTFSYPAGNCSFPSEVSTAVGGSTHTVSMQYDFNTGKMTQHTDPAGVATALVYEAALGRLSQVTNGHGTSFARTSTIAYNDNANTVTVTAPVADAEAPRIPVAIHAVTTTRYDGLGRVTETEQATGGSPVIVKTAYDALGRVASTSLPSDDGNYQYVAFAYDALDRRTKATNADGSAVRTCYAGDLAISRDEAGKWRQTKSDALGRLIEVVEDPAGAQCDGQTNSSSGLSYLTKYAYDAMDNLLSVDEGGRMRSFSYDWPGRLLSAANPESGTVNYVYDNNGNLTQKTDARGVVTSYTYDELNRPLAKTYSGGAGAPSVAWAWDTGKVGKLTSVDAATPQGSFSKTSYTYDAVGRIAASVQRTEGVDYPFEYRYYKGWGLRQVKYPSGRWVRYTPDAAGRAVSVE
ncbi:MAG: hypothetical protein LC114_17920, partial [Bryobacterales bacterium]|nr:hypothetical protein [Bryobacterales bacterium]